MALSHVMNIISNAGAVSAGTGSGGGGGGGGGLDTQTVTSASDSEFLAGGSGLPSSTTTWHGKYANGYHTDGSVSDGTSNLYSGASIVELYYTWNTVYGIAMLALKIDGTNRANSGWTTLTVGTTAYQRTAASYNGSVSGDTQWAWTQSNPADLDGSYNPFNAAGQTTACVFT